jgi:hypothetical protein
LILQRVSNIKVDKIVLYLRASYPVILTKYHAGNKTRAVIWSGKLLYKWLAVVDKATNLHYGQEAGKFITSPCKRTLFHAVTKFIKTQALHFFCVTAGFRRSVNEICLFFFRILRTEEW